MQHEREGRLWLGTCLGRETTVVLRDRDGDGDFETARQLTRREWRDAYPWSDWTHDFVNYP